jgi:hypothetical protein
MEYTRLAAATIVSAPGAVGVGTASAGSAAGSAAGSGQAVGQAIPRGDDGTATDVAVVVAPVLTAARLTGPARVAPSQGGVTAANRAW